MTFNHLIQAIQECNDDKLNFNNGVKLQCFLYENTWYPMIAVVKRALEIAKQPKPKLNSRDALFNLFNVLPYVKYQNIHVQNNILVDLLPREKLNEIAFLSDMIKTLAKN